MGVYERDWARRPKAASRPLGRALPTARGQRHWLVWIVGALLLFVGVKFLLEQRRAQPFPQTGAVHWYMDTAGKPTAKLTVEAPRYSAAALDFVVRLDQWEGRAPVAMIPVRGGETAVVEVPLGRYRVTIVKGTGWQGPERHFGMRSMAQEGVHPMEFTRVGNQRMGHVLRLEQLNGNMETKPARL